MANTNEQLKSFRVDQLRVVIYSSRLALGEATARSVAEQMRQRLRKQSRISMIFAAAPSQEEFLAALATQENLDWQRVTAFQMDEYIGLPADAPQNFGRFLRERLFSRVRPGTVHCFSSEKNPADEIVRYSRLIRELPPDITCAGIGENGHLAFNDPPVADFADPVAVKVVQLAERSRQQQVHDGCFDAIEEVPTSALTLTIPILLSASYFSCVVPGPRKAEAVRQMLLGQIATDCPASILRRHSHAVLHLDRESAARIPETIS
jgi:glucosamine-6-phosphate deaminase